MKYDLGRRKGKRMSKSKAQRVADYRGAETDGSRSRDRRRCAGMSPCEGDGYCVLSRLKKEPAFAVVASYHSFCVDRDHSSAPILPSSRAFSTTLMNTSFFSLAVYHLQAVRQPGLTR